MKPREPRPGEADPKQIPAATAMEDSAKPQPEAPLETQIVSSIRRILRAVDQSSRRLLETCGLSAPQLAALRALERTGPLTPSALARAIYLSHPTVTGILGRLEGRGLVRREPGPRDRRTVLVHVTAAGLELLDRAPSLLQERFQRELARLAHWERLSILAHMERVAGLLEAEHLDAAPHLVSNTEELIGPDPGEHLAPQDSGSATPPQRNLNP
ncbi:MAG: MarR family transcriptional regulator [Planctomycetaceae bacterium]|nr:MarR family transcriptional regulator [Planctomycetaceae bacterium]